MQALLVFAALVGGCYWLYTKDLLATAFTLGTSIGTIVILIASWYATRHWTNDDYRAHMRRVYGPSPKRRNRRR